MRILLDECVNQRLRNYLPGHYCESAEYAGFAGLKNGELLNAAESAHFDVLLTVDRGLEYEQNLAGGESPSSFSGRNRSLCRSCCRTCPLA